MYIKNFQFFLPVALLVLLILGGIVASVLPQNVTKIDIEPAYKNIQVGSVVVHVEVASTSAEREKGLSGHMPLGASEGMLFIFDWSNTWGFWMKDMQFAIDII